MIFMCAPHPPPQKANGPPLRICGCCGQVLTVYLFIPCRFVTTSLSVSVLAVGKEPTVVFGGSVEQKVSYPALGL